jgi:L-alanine-DL-glutamate epimerase-like enolase superfamily enzyme
MHAELIRTPLITTYQYSRATDATCTLLRVHLDEGRYRGRGEGSPFESFFVSDASTALQAIEAAAELVNAGGSVEDILDGMDDMPAKNALEAAWLDLRAKREQVTVAELLCITPPSALTVMTTIAMGNLRTVAQDLERTKDHPLLKLKLGAADDVARLELVRTGRPDARLTVDVNAGWTATRFAEMLPALIDADVEMVEQPVSEAEESLLPTIKSPIPVVADESFSSAADLPRIRRYYDGANVKLDKCGGLTAALSCIRLAKSLDLRVMVGCLPASSLSTAVGMHVGQFAEWVDLDNHLWMAEDVHPAIGYRNGILTPPAPDLWG